MKKIRVKILETGTEAKEVDDYVHKVANDIEDELKPMRTFEIDGLLRPFGEEIRYVPGTIHDAILMENGKIKIID